MKKKLSTMLTVLLIAMFTISIADAGGGIKISSNPTFSLGSLITDGFLQGTDQTPITVVLEAQGTCPIGDVFAGGTQFLPGSKESGTKDNTKREFRVETTLQIGDDGVCNNEVDSSNFVLWNQATISVYSGNVDLCDVTNLCGEIGLTSSIAAADNAPAPLVQQVYNCTTNPDTHIRTVSCKPVKNHGSNNGNGTVAICHATGSNKKPYVLLTVNANGLNGHGKHTGDIIPAPASGCLR